MAVQSRLDIDITPFFLSGNVLTKDSEIIAQDAGRTEDLLQYTLMAQIAADKKWVPFTDETATYGTAIVKGIYTGGDIDAAAIAAGDVEDIAIVVGGSTATFAEDKLIIENSKTLDTIIEAGTINAHRVEDDLNGIGLYPESTVDISSYETI